MKTAAQQNTLQHLTVGRTLRAVRLESPYLAATVLLDQGGDILELVHKPTSIDVLWKVPYPLREPGIGPTPAGDSYAQWMHYYRGGWQTIFPNFGPSVMFRGASLDFHGEAARRPWQLESEGNSEIEISTDLACLPFSIHRRISLSEVHPELTVQETIANSSNAPLECMWAHHPVFGAPLLSPESRIYTGAQLIHTDDAYDVPGNDLPLGRIFEWPFARSKTGDCVDLSHVPAAGSGFSRVVFLKQFAEPWCAIANPTIPLGVALRWNGELMPHMCLWQETGGECGFPHFAKTYTTALEPATSLFGHGLLDAIENTRTQLTLQPGEARTLYLKAVLFEDCRSVQSVSAEGVVEFRS
jgi:galactose mutarotase-like enzyme